MRRLLLAAGIAAITLVTFAPVRGFSFVNYDDFEFVVENPHVATGLTPGNLRWALAHPYEATGGPVTWLSHMLDVQRAGLDPGAHHVTSLLLHALNAVLLFLVLSRMTGDTGPSALVAALFAVHPLHVESVAWISARKDLLSTAFWLLSMAAYDAYVRRPGRARYLLTALAFALGLLSKPMVATLPIVLLLLDRWPLRRWRAGGERLARLATEKVPLVIMAAAAAVLTFAAQRQIGAVMDVRTIPAGQRFANGTLSYAAYIAHTVWPSGLVPFYPYRTGVPILAVAATLAGLALATWAATREWQRAPFVTVGWYWFLVTLAPVIGIVQVGGHGMADRFTYVPLIGLFIVAAWGGSAVLARTGAGRHVPAAIALSMVLACAWVSRAQAMHWRNGVELWSHAIRVDPENARAHANLGVALASAGDRHEAINEYEAALRLDPGDPRSHNNLALALAESGRSEEALVHYRAAVSIDPDYTSARVNLANLLDEQGRSAEAIAEYRQALGRDPQHLLAKANLAMALGKAGRPGEAIPVMLDVVRRDPANAHWHYVIAMMWVQQDHPREAIAELEEAVRLNPRDDTARRALAELR